MSKTREKDSDRMVQLTLSNAVDQTQKILVEVPAGTSVADAARDAGIAPQGSFDVFTAGGEAVTRSNVDRHRDSVLYVEPQKVAGGSEEFVLEPEPGVAVAANPPAGPKAVTFVSAYDSSVRHEVIPQEGQNIRDAASMAGLAPRDGSSWQVYDALGSEVGDRSANDMTGEVLYVGPQAIEAGGINIEELSRARADFPSIKSIKGHSSENKVDMIHVEIKDERSRSLGDNFECVVDVRTDSWSTHIVNLNEEIRVPHVYTRSKIPGTEKRSSIVCQGDYEMILEESRENGSVRLSAYLNHISSLLNS